MTYRIFFFIVCIILTNNYVYPISPDYEKGYQAYVKEDYQTAIAHLKIAVNTTDKKNADAWFHLGISYFKIQQFSKARSALEKAYEYTNDPKLKDKYRKALTEVDDGNSIQNKIGDTSINSFPVYIYYILSAIGIILLIVLIIFLSKRNNTKGKREYKEHTINQDLLDNLNNLNSEFLTGKTLILEHGSNDEQDEISEIEDRCIALNDKLEELRYGLRKVDVEIFKDEIEITREMLKECINRAKQTQSV